LNHSKRPRKTSEILESWEVRDEVGVI